MKIRTVEAELFHADRRTDRHDEANSHSSQFCERAQLNFPSPSSNTMSRNITATELLTEKARNRTVKMAALRRPPSTRNYLCSDQQQRPNKLRALHQFSIYYALNFNVQLAVSFKLQAESVDKKNQLDVTFCILYYSSNSCSTCFGQPCAHHQELKTV